MNKTIKHILKGILFVVIAIVVIFLCIRTYYKFFNSNDADLTTEETDILLLSQTYPTTFYFIGDTIPLDKSIIFHHSKRKEGCRRHHNCQKGMGDACY